MPFLQNKRQIIVGLILLILAIVALAAFITFKKTSIQPQKLLTVDLKKGIYKCPATKKFCETGKNIFIGDSYAGFGGEAATGSAVLASFDGLATGLTITLPTQFKSEKLNVIYLDNKEHNLTATYYFKGESLNFNNIAVKEGMNIGKIGGKMDYYNTFLLFTITNGTALDGDEIRVTAKDFITQ